MSGLERKGGSRPPRRQREQRAYRLVQGGIGAGVIAAIGFVLALVGIIGWGGPVIAAVVAVVCFLLFQRTVSR